MFQKSPTRTLARNINSLIVAGLLLFTAAANAEKKSTSPCGMVPAIIGQVAAIRGLKVMGPVPCFVKNKEQVAISLKSLVKEKISDNRLMAEGGVYKAIGLIPKDFDYATGLIELYVSQLGGYYDPSHRYFVMADWIPAAFQVPVAAHELTHALQDQHFDLNTFTSTKIENGDKLMARSALIEGDATAAMMDYTRKASGQQPLASEASVSNIMLQNLAGGGFSPSLGKVPQSLQLALFFPYTSGLRFAHELLRRGGYPAIDAAFKNPPSSTTEILHPEKYFDNSLKLATISEAELARGCVVEHRDTIGEFLISALLSAATADKSLVSDAAAGWANDSVLLTKCSGGQTVVRWRIAWQSEKDRDEFLKLYPINSAKREEYVASKENAAFYFTEFSWQQ